MYADVSFKMFKIYVNICLYVFVSPFFTDFLLSYNIHYIFVIYIYMINICFPMRIQRIENPAAGCSGSEDSGLTERRNGLGGLWRSHAIAICGHGHGDSGT